MTAKEKCHAPKSMALRQQRFCNYGIDTTTVFDITPLATAFRL